MYKHLRKILKNSQKTPDLFKAISDPYHSFQKPHILMSAENPHHHQELKMSHEDTLKMLQNKGYDASEVKGKYGSPETSIMVKNPPKHSNKHFHELARKLGQESLIFSDGYNHEMHYVNGENAGKHIKGQGTEIHHKEPEDFYTTDENGTHFSHNFNFNELHNKSNMVKPIAQKMNKSESESESRYIMCKNERKPHILDNQHGGINLIHFSPKEGMKTIDPNTMGSRGIGSESKRGVPEHRMNFYYLEGTKPEDIVTSGAKSKYVTSLGNKKVYDIAKDPEHIWSGLKEKSMQRQMNQGVVSRDDYHEAIKNAGYHGIYNSSLDDTIRNAVGMFSPMSVEAEHPIHPNDFMEASSIDHHANDISRKRAGDHAAVSGESTGDFLFGLKQSFENQDDD